MSTPTKSILSRITQQQRQLPPRLLLAGPIGIGKTSFAAQAPDPLFICAEDGLLGMDHVQRFSPADLTDLNALLDGIAAEGLTDFKTLVIDTFDWLERLIYDHVLKRDGKKNVEAYGGYGKEQNVAEPEFLAILRKLDDIRVKYSMGIIILSHVKIKEFHDPSGVSYDRYELKGSKKLIGVLAEWVDAYLFTVYEVFQTGGKDETKTVGGERIIHTEWNPAWDAKNRLNLPSVIPLSYAAFVAEVEQNSTSALRQRALTLAGTAKWETPEKEAVSRKYIKSAIALDLKDAIKRLEEMQ